MIDAIDPKDPTRMVCAPFMVRIEGPEKSFQNEDGNNHPPPIGMSRNEPRQVPTAGPRLAPRTVSDPSRDPRRYMEQTPDAIASRGWDNEHAERRELRGQYDRERREHSLRVEKMREEQVALQAEMAKQRTDSDRRLMEFQIESLKTQQQAAPRTDWVGLAAALAPVAVGMLESSRSRGLESVAAQAAREGQSNDLVKAVLTRGSGMEDVMKNVLAIAPAVAPLVKAWMDNNSPKHESELMMAMSDQAMTQASMSVQMFRELSELQGGDPPWMSIVQEMAGGAERIMEAVVSNRGGPVPPAPDGSSVVSAAPAVTPPSPAAGPAQEVEGEVVDSAPEGAVHASPEAVDRATEVMNQVMPTLPAYLRTDQWASVVYHSLSEDPSKITPIAEEIFVLVQASPTSQELQRFVQDPDVVLAELLTLIPISDEYRGKLHTVFKNVVAAEQLEKAPEESSNAAADVNGADRPRPSGMLVGDQIPAHARIRSTRAN